MLINKRNKRNQPRYSQIKSEIIDKIKSGEYEQGEFLPTLTEICNHYNVSMITSQRAFVELAELGYVERRQGRKAIVTLPTSLKVNKSIGIVYAAGDKSKPDYRHAPWGATILNAIQNTILSDGNIMTLIPENYDYLSIADSLSGYILIDSHLRTELYDQLKATGKPFVVICPHSVHGVRPNQIAPTYHQAGIELAEHFLRGGMKSFGYLVPHEMGEHAHANLKSRMQSFFETIANYGFNIENFKFFECGFYQHEAYADMRELLKSGQLKPPFGLISLGDFIAMGACTALMEAGLQVRKDFMIVGSSGLDVIAQFAPKLSTFVQPLTEMAHQAVALIYDQIRENTTVIPGKGMLVQFIANET